MHPELIKAHIRIAGTTPAAIADELGYTRTAVAHAIIGVTRSARIRAHIAALLGKPVEALWPDVARPASGLRRGRGPGKKQQPQQVARDQHGFPVDALVIGSPEALAHVQRQRDARKAAARKPVAVAPDMVVELLP